MHNQSMASVPETVAGRARTFLDRLVARLRNDDRMAALLLGGSHAAGTADEHSDLDLTLLTRESHWEDVYEGRMDLLRSLGDILFLEEHSDFGFLLLLFIYGDGVRGELSLAPASDVASVLSGPNVALFDNNDLLARYEPKSLEEPTRKDLVRRTLVWFWYDRGLLHVFLARRKLWTAHFYLERCRERCFDLAWLMERPEVWPGGHEKVDLLLEASTLERLAPTVVPLEANALEAAAAVITDFYLELGPRVASCAGIPFPSRLAEAVGRRVGRS
jgi:hypothetical protein